MSITYHKADPVELEFQFRAMADGSSSFEGYAAVYNQPSKPLMDQIARGKPYVETFSLGAFRRTLGDTQARKSFVVDHNERMMISSSPNGPLRLADDTRGVYVASPWPSTDYANNVRALYDAGERPGMSIYFGTNPRGKASDGRPAEEWSPRNDARTVNEAVLRHVSVLATMEPAYDGTVANFRGLADLTETSVEDVDALMEALRDGRRLDEGEFNLLTKLTEAVRPEVGETVVSNDADRAATDKWLARMEEIEASLPKS